MGEKSGSVKIPKKVLGFKLSKGTRKDLRKLLSLLESSQGKALAVSAAGGLAAWFAERHAQGEGPLADATQKARSRAPAH